MSIDNSQCVESKYFVGKTAMDESLSDFQETKQNCKGPKTTQKTVKSKTRKVTKRIKGQKDIRAALKVKKNELISYSKEFDNVCKDSGLDVDSEQLQLAIALSKSLQTQIPDDASTSQSLSTQGRIAKIRTTLQEYGFRVPETKINTSNKRTKKHKKQYKLLNTTEEERHQKITSKYSQILFRSLDCSISNKHFNQESDITVYNFATNLKYECMRDNNIFYVNNLIEKSTSSGCLLRDWSEIPGRPVSPILFETSAMDFSQIVCSQDELDIILSGPINSAKDIIATKQIKAKKNHVCKIPKVLIDIEDEKNEQLANANDIQKDNIGDENSIMVDEEIHVPVENSLKSSGKEIETVNKASDLSNVESICSLTVREQYRSCSPDIFDDEVSCIMEVSRPVISSQEQKTKVFTEETNYLDLTECINNVVSQNIQKTTFTSQNITKRKSDDFMEITECAVSASQGIHENVKEIDLTQVPEEISLIMGTRNSSSCNFSYVAESPDHSMNDNDEVLIAGQLRSKDIVQDDIDLTQSSNDDNDLSIIEQKKQVPYLTSVTAIAIEDNNGIEMEDHLNIENSPQLFRDDIDLTQGSIKDMGCIHENSKIYESTDLTQSSKSSIDIDDLPDVKLVNTQKSQSDLDDTIILNKEEYIGANGKLKKSIIVESIQTFDLTQADNDSARHPKTNICSQSFYEDFVHDHSDSKENIENNELCDDNNSVHNRSYDIDLTQSSDGSARNSTSPKTVFENIPNNSSLGKKYEISIDYDEICEYVSDKESNYESVDKESHNSKCDSSKSQVCIDHNDSNYDLVSNSSQNSIAFDLTDKELDYSIHKSRHEVVENYNYDFGGISIMDDVTGVKSFRESLDQKTNNRTVDDSFLPEVNIKKTEEKCKSADSFVHKPIAFSPVKADNIAQSSKGTVPVVTPQNSKYIIKMHDVTPMLDYESMTTPQRNRELDKYGLKPFKRKRAIKILTHLYNQTHPVLEPYADDDQPSPSKKPRLNINLLSHTSPRKILKSPRKDQETNKNETTPREGAIRNSKSPKKASEIDRNVNCLSKKGNSSKENLICAYEGSDEVPNIRSVECHPEDWVFQKREKAKVHSCRVPLHIAFHNYVSSRQALREAILKYEPVNIDVIHKDLVSYGHRYDPKDLLRFLDKKCITVKTMDNNARNKR